VRVYSKFHDYYDPVQSRQYDERGEKWIRDSFHVERSDVQKVLAMLRIECESLHQVFKPRDAVVLKNGYNLSRIRGLEHSCLACLVCVAGKVYPMIETHFKHYRGGEWHSWVNQHYTFDEFHAGSIYMGEDCKFYGKPIYPQWFFSINREAPTSKPWELLNTPVFIIRPMAGDWRSKEYSIEGNPELKPLGFIRVLDPYTIWQEIDMFINNQLVHEADPSTVPDKYRWSQYGFDERWSFRTKPTS